MNANKIRNLICSRSYNGFQSRLYCKSYIPDLGRQAARVTSVQALRRASSGRPNLQHRRPHHRPIAGLPTGPHMSHRVPIEPQRVDAPLTQSATFLVLTVTDSPNAIKTVRSTLASINELAKNV